ncbi:hypothetical protein ZWY2020_059984 [Hordeum vulgare]|nr:hypothetical protein ZWY2020_059984 [Hordeum vulgare]
MHGAHKAETTHKASPTCLEIGRREEEELTTVGATGLDGEIDPTEKQGGTNWHGHSSEHPAQIVELHSLILLLDLHHRDSHTCPIPPPRPPQQLITGSPPPPEKVRRNRWAAIYAETDLVEGANGVVTGEKNDVGCGAT